METIITLMNNNITDHLMVSQDPFTIVIYVLFALFFGVMWTALAVSGPFFFPPFIMCLVLYDSNLYVCSFGLLGVEGSYKQGERSDNEKLNDLFNW